MENTIENKAKFFALYWGQSQILKVSKKASAKQKVDRYFIGELDEWPEVHLILNPLSQITDEHAIEVARILLKGLPERSISRRLDLGKTIVSEISKNYGLGSITSNQFIEIIEFLRGEGYYIGDGTEVQYGWVELR